MKREHLTHSGKLIMYKLWIGFREQFNYIDFIQNFMLELPVKNNEYLINGFMHILYVRPNF